MFIKELRQVFYYKSVIFRVFVQDNFEKYCILTEKFLLFAFLEIVLRV